MEFFSIRHRVQTGSETNPASYSVGTGDSSPGVKRPECGAYNSTHLVPSLKMCGSVLPLSQYVFMAWCLVKA